MPIEIQYGYHWLIPAMYICWDKVCAENYCGDGFMLEYGVAKRLCLRKGKTLDVFSEKRYDDDEFPRKEGYILWQSRSSPFNFQNLCFFVAKLWDHIILSLNTGNADILSSTEYMGKQNCFICKMIHVLSFTTL